MIHFVILCGGQGERLWPKSRSCFPKQFLETPENISLFQTTLTRIYNIIQNNEYITADIKVIGNASYQHILQQQISELNMKVKVQLILEPEGRDSAPAIAIASLLSKPTDYTYIFSCDHLLDESTLEKVIGESLGYITNSIITFGVVPFYPETGFGYIKVKDLTTLEFKEKPTLEVAKQYVESKEYLWNSGMFAFKNVNMLRCFEKLCPDLLESCKKSFSNTSDSVIHLNDIFNTCDKISIDYAIMEKIVQTQSTNTEFNLITLPFNGKWSDIGNYKALWENYPQDKNNNVLKGNVNALNTKNCYIDSENHHISTFGVENLVIIQTDDALLVSSLDECANVKQIVASLKGTKNENLLKEHKLMFRPWGWYKNVEGNDYNGFKMKRIAVYPGKRLSLQSHNQRQEHWVIVTGVGIVQLGEICSKVIKGDHVFIPLGVLHRIKNIGEDMLEFTETQIGEYLGEDDIIRYQDDFGRENK